MGCSRQGRQGRGCGCWGRQDPSHLLLQARQGRQPFQQDRLACGRVREAPQRGAGSLAHWSRQVPPLQVEGNMQKSGILEVDRIGGKAGNWVFVNAHSVGLSSKLSDFEGLSVRMTHYQKTLAKLTGKLAQKHKKAVKT